MTRAGVHSSDGARRFDAIVIGSGFGGAVSAARLAEQGLSVLVLERGPWWGPAGEGQPSADRRPWPRGALGLRKGVRGIRWGRGRRSREALLNADGLFELHVFERLGVLTGSGVGGGSLIYTSIQAQPEDPWFDAFPDEISADEMRPYYDRVRAMQRPSPLPDRPDKNLAFERAAHRAGLEVEYPDLAIAFGNDPAAPRPVQNAAGVRQLTSTHAGTDILGCEDRSKTTLDLTYIPWALRHGAELRPLCEALAVGRAGRRYRVRWIDHRSGRQWQTDAPYVFVSAGTLGTLRLLFSARDRFRTLPDLPRALGRRFSPNGDMGAVILGSPELRDSGYGPPCNAFVRWRDEQGHHRFLVSEVGLPLGALPLPSRARRLLSSSAIFFAMGREAPATGAVDYDGRSLRTSLDRSLDDDLFAAIERSLKLLGAGYRPRRLYVNSPYRSGSTALATIHPLGGAGIASHPEEGVVDHTGRVFGQPGLYVADGSLYPGPPGLPPSLTIAALAERQAALFVENASSAMPERSTA